MNTQNTILFIIFSLILSVSHQHEKILALPLKETGIALGTLSAISLAYTLNDYQKECKKTKAPFSISKFMTHIKNKKKLKALVGINTALWAALGIVCGYNYCQNTKKPQQNTVPEEGSLTISADDLDLKKTLTENRKTFEQKVRPFPLTTNTFDGMVKDITDPKEKEKLLQEHLEHAKNTHPILHNKTIQLIEDFLTTKKKYGSKVEKELYKNMTHEEFITRLLTKRPLTFLNIHDYYILQNGKTGFGATEKERHEYFVCKHENRPQRDERESSGGFERIGTDNEDPDLSFRDYISYDEMQISALLGVSTPTHFINDGSRINAGVPGQEGTFTKKGIMVGTVGARFHRAGVMEYPHIIVSKHQNTEENGYGKQSKNELLKTWAKFYEIDHFATYEEAKNDTTGRFIKLKDDTFFDIITYKKRMRMVVEPFLLDAQHRGKQANKKVYVSASGLGLGVWAIQEIKEQQSHFLAEVYAETLEEHDLDHISDIDFTWWPGLKKVGTHAHAEKIKNTKIHITKNPACPKIEEDKLLVTQYAWDANAFPGNEYHKVTKKLLEGSVYPTKLDRNDPAYDLITSADPAAVGCSLIQELQNPYINPFVAGKHTAYYGE